MESADTFEHAGLPVEIVYDEEPGYGPQDNDNAGTIYSWVYSRNFEGDEYIGEPDLEILCTLCGGNGMVDGSDEPTAARYDQRTCPKCEGTSYLKVDIPQFFAEMYDAVLTIPLYFADYGSSGARIYVSDDPNCAICFTQKEIDHEWSGSVDDATRYAEGRINELDEFFQGYSFGIVIRNPETREVMESVWGFIGDLHGETGKYIYEEAKGMAEACAEEIAEEKAEAYRWACRGVVTV